MQIGSVLHRMEIFFIAEHEARLAGRAERNDVTIGVTAGQDVFAARKRIEIIAVEQISHCAIVKGAISSHLVGEEERLGQNVGLIIWRIFFADAVMSTLEECREVRRGRRAERDREPA